MADKFVFFKIAVEWIVWTRAAVGQKEDVLSMSE